MGLLFGLALLLATLSPAGTQPFLAGNSCQLLNSTQGGLRGALSCSRIELGAGIFEGPENCGIVIRSPVTIVGAGQGASILQCNVTHIYVQETEVNITGLSFLYLKRRSDSNAHATSHRNFVAPELVTYESISMHANGPEASPKGALPELFHSAWKAYLNSNEDPRSSTWGARAGTSTCDPQPGQGCLISTGADVSLRETDFHSCQGPATQIFNSNWRLVDVQIRNSSTNSCGGGLYATSSTVAASNLIVEDNTVWGESQDQFTGGGAYFYMSNVSLTDSGFRRNVMTNLRSGLGGGLGLLNCNLTMVGCCVENNTMSVSDIASGGGLALAESAFAIESSNFTRNTLYSTNRAFGGGVLVVLEGVPILPPSNTLVASVVNENNVTGQIAALGAGIAFLGAGLLSIQSSSILYNILSCPFFTHGGGVWIRPLEATRVVVDGSHVVGNEVHSGALTAGAGIFVQVVKPVSLVVELVASELNNNTIMCDQPHLEPCYAQGGALFVGSTSSFSGHFNESTSVQITRCQLNFNLILCREPPCPTFGAGIATFFFHHTGTLAIERSNITGNFNNAACLFDPLCGAVAGGVIALNTHVRVLSTSIRQNRVVCGGAFCFALGGGLFAFTATLQMTDSESVDNEVIGITESCEQSGVLCGAGGGGVFIFNGELSLTRVELRNNYVWCEGSLCASFGAGLNSWEVVQTHSGLVLSNNSAACFTPPTSNGCLPKGGGWYVNGGQAWMNASSFTDNQVFSPVTTVTFPDDMYSGGAGVCVDNGMLQLTNVTFTQNLVNNADGGGVLSSGNLSVFNCSFLGNRCESNGVRGGKGGGILLTPTAYSSVAQCTFRNNYGEPCPSPLDALTLVPAVAYEGGALFESGVLDLVDSIFSENVADRAGGALVVGLTSSATMQQCEFRHNSAAYGGAVYTQAAGHGVFQQCQFAHNNATIWGGGAVHLASTELSRFECCSFTANRAMYTGGAVDNAGKSGPGVLVNCTIANNSAGIDGGGIHIRSDPISMKRCLLTNNTADNQRGTALFIGSSVRTTVEFSGVVFDTGTATADGSDVYLQLASPPALFNGCLFRNNRISSQYSPFPIGLARSAICGGFLNCTSPFQGEPRLITGSFHYSDDAGIGCMSSTDPVDHDNAVSVQPQGSVKPDLTAGCLCAGQRVGFRTAPALTYTISAAYSIAVSLSASSYTTGSASVAMSAGSLLPIADPLATALAQNRSFARLHDGSFQPAKPHDEGYYSVAVVASQVAPVCFELAIQTNSPSWVKTDVELVGTQSHVLFTGQGGVSAILSFKDERDWPISVDHDTVHASIPSKHINIECNTHIAHAMSSQLLCSVHVGGAFGAEGTADVIVNGRVSGQLRVVWIGWPILGGVVAAMLLFSLLTFWFIRWKRRQQRRQLNHLLADYADLSHQKQRTDKMLHNFVEVGGTQNEPLLLDQRLLLPFEELEVLHDVAAGATAKVSLARWRKTLVAAKQYFGITSDNMSALVKECAVHQGLRHPNVVQLIGICTSPVCLVTEWMSRGSMHALLHAHDGPPSWPLRLKLLGDAANGITYLHSCGLLHRDLKSKNILVGNNWQAKVCDFGTTTQECSVHTAALMGTLLWCAPELFDRTGKYDSKADVYSFGIVMWEGWSCRDPYEFNTDAPRGWPMLGFIQSGGRPSLPPDLEPDSWFSALYRLCWQQDPQDRPTFETIVATLAPEIAVVLEQMEVELGKAGTGPPSPGDQSRNNSYTSISAASFANALQRSWSTNMSDMASPPSEDMKTPLLP